MTDPPAVPIVSRGQRLISFALVAAWIAIAAGSFQPFYLKIFRIDIPSLRARLTELPYRKTPGLRSALVEVARRTPPGAHILLWTPDHTWDPRYDYAYRRAQFLLAGRDVIPLLVSNRDGIDARNPSAAQFIACWPECPPAPPGFVVDWRGDTGMLLRRTP